MRVLVACEESQTVCKAFRARGHEAYSCDIQDCSGGYPEWHIQEDVLSIINNEWDVMIAHPPCTYIAKAGLHYLNTRPERRDKLVSAVDFFKRLYHADIPKIAVENPSGWLNTNWKKPSQIIHPYYFGESAIKETCLWLRGLEPLHYRFQDDLFGKRTAVDRPCPEKFIIRKSGRDKGKKYYYRWRDGKTAKERSKTFKSIADAMAEQWG